MKYKKGELVALSGGEYSDYCVNALVRALVDFDASEMLLVWAKEADVQSVHGAYCPDPREIGFIGWLNKCGLIEDVEYKELHTGDYGEVELTDYTDY